jgi:hypothetical protein
MRILLALTVFAFACGGPKAKTQSSIVNEGSDQPPTCCCKTMPMVGEHDIQPVYDMKARMECSTANGDCVDDVQCNGQNNQPQQAQGTGTGGDGNPPPPPDLPANP